MRKRHLTIQHLLLLSSCLFLWHCGQPDQLNESTEAFVPTTSQNIDLNSWLAPKGAIAFHDPLDHKRPFDIKRLIINPTNGHFLILEQNATRGVLEFDGQANYIRSFSKRGEGDQDYLAPIDMALHPGTQQLYFLSSFKIFQFDLAQGQVRYFTIDQLFPHLSSLASFCALDLNANQLSLILEDMSSQGYITRYFYQLELPLKAEATYSELATAKKISQQSDQVGKSAIIATQEHTYIIEPPDHHLRQHHQTTLSATFKNPSIDLLNDINTSQTSYPLQIYSKQADALWFRFQKTDGISWRHRFYFVSGVLYPNTGQVKLFQPPSGKDMTPNVIALLHSKSHLLTIHQDKYYGIVKSNDSWQVIQQQFPNLTWLGNRERPADVIVFEANDQG